MEDIGILTSLSDEMAQFSQEAERVEKAKLIIGFYGWILKLYCWKHRKLIKKFYLAMGVCNQLCPNAACLEKIYPDIKIVRDQFAKIHQASLLTPLLAPLRPPLDKMLDDWNELVEDCVIAMDPEIHGLINQIADAL